MLRQLTRSVSRITHQTRGKKSPIVPHDDIDKFKTVLPNEENVKPLKNSNNLFFEDKEIKEFPDNIWEKSIKFRRRSVSSVETRRIYVQDGKEYTLRIGFWYYRNQIVRGVKVMLRLGSLRPGKVFLFKNYDNNVEKTIKASEDFYELSTGIRLDEIQLNKNQSL